MIEKSLLVVAALAASAVFGADCPTPKPLTCEQLEAKLAARCPVKATCEACPECKPVVVPVPGPVEKHYIYEDVVMYPPAQAKVLFGGGLLYQAEEAGLTAVAGYQFKSGWQVLAGPTWVNHKQVNGVASGCGRRLDGHGNPHGHEVCLNIPYTVSAPNSWGGQVLVVYAFGAK